MLLGEALTLANKLMQAPNMIGQSSLHCRRNPQSHIHAAEIVPCHKQRHSRFQVGYGFARCVGFAREASQVHPNAQVGPFDVRSRDAGEIRHPRLNSRYGCDDCAAAVPFWASLRTPVNLLQLREVDVIPVPFLNCADIAAQGIRRDLKAPNCAQAEIMYELIGVDGIPSADVVRENHFALAVERKPRPLVAPSGRRFQGNALAVASHVAPQLIELHEFRVDVTNLSVEYPLRSFGSGVHQGQDRFDMQARQPRDSADTRSFQHHGKRTDGSVGVGVVYAQLGNIGGERGRAGSAAIVLNLALAVEAESLHGIMVTTFAGHISQSFLIEE